MLSLKKLARDLWLTRSRALIMVASIAVGLTAFGALVGAYSILTREVARNYIESEPASILLEMEDVDERTLQWVLRRPGIEAATRRTQVRGRFSTERDPTKRRAFFFVIDDFEEMDVAKLFPESGAFPPKPGTALMERSAVSVAGSGVGARLFVDLPGRAQVPVEVSGIVHEPALAPATTEQAVYLYLTQEDLAELGFEVAFDELRLTPTGRQDLPTLEAKARELSQELEEAGFGPVTAIRVPPPGQHPHQMQMTTVLTLFIIFAGLIVVLSSLLTASLLSTMMARQVREIGIMKTLGARSFQILMSYALLVELIALLAWGLSFFPAEAGAQMFVQAITQLLNFDVANDSQSRGARLLQAAVALFVPLLLALPALVRASGVSVMGALTDYGMGSSFGKGRLERWVVRWKAQGELFAYALRTAVRRRGRFLLSLALLSTAGGIFLSSVNTARSWEVLTERLYTSRHYHLDVSFAGPVDSSSLAARLEATPEVEEVEVWHSTRTAPAAGQELPIERTYPDGAHGALSLVAVPLSSTMVSFDVQEGRLLDASSRGEVVVNQVVPHAGTVSVGDELALSIDGQDHRLRVVGKVEEVGTGATAYVSPQTFEDLVEGDHRQTSLRVQKANDVEMAEALSAINRVMEAQGAPVTHVSPLSVFENAVAAHFEILVNSLIALAVLTALVGAMGLGAALSANVAESTREIAVLRAVGASGGQVRRLVVWEALLVSGVSFVAASALGLGLSAVIGRVIGMMSFGLPLPLSPRLGFFFALMVALLGLGALASLLPARRASHLTVAQALRAL